MASFYFFIFSGTYIWLTYFEVVDNSSCRPQCMLSNSTLPCNIMTFLFFLGILHMNSITLFKAYSIELNTMKNTWESRDQIYCKSQFTGDMNSWWEIFCCSVALLCPTLCDLIDCRTPGFLVLHYFLEFAQTHIHWEETKLSRILVITYYLILKTKEGNN